MILAAAVIAVLASRPHLIQEPPAPPTGVSASTPANGQIQVSWSQSPTGGGYNVYRSMVSQGTYTKLNGSPLSNSTTSLLDSGLNNGSRYFYVVRVEISGPLESANSAEVWAQVTGSDQTPPSAPVITSQARKTRDSTPSTSGTGEPGTILRLYRDAAGTSLIGSVTVSMTGTWTIANPSALGVDGTYLLTAKSFDASNESPISTPLQIDLDTFPPSAPTGVITTSYNNCIDVEWTNSTANDVAGYKVERKTGVNGSWSTLHSNLVVGGKYRDNTAVNGTTYYFRVIAVDNAVDY